MIRVVFHIPNDSPVIETWPDWADEARVKEHARMLGALCYRYEEGGDVDAGDRRVCRAGGVGVVAVPGGGME